MTSRRSAGLALFGGGVLAASAERAQATTQFSAFEAVADATIFAEQSGGTAYDAVADGRGGNLWTSVLAAGVVRRALVRFDLSALPAGAQVVSVQVEAFMIRLREPQTIALHRITAPWSEGPANGGDAGIGAPASAGDCTWSHRVWPNQPWATRGGEGTDLALLSASAMLAAPLAWRQRLIGLAIMLFAVFVLNQVRLLVLLQTHLNMPQHFEQLHTLWLPLLMVLLLGGLLLTWVGRFARP